MDWTGLNWLNGNAHPDIKRSQHVSQHVVPRPGETVIVPAGWWQCSVALEWNAWLLMNSVCLELLSSWSAKALHDHLQTFLEQVLFYKRRSSIHIHRTTLDFEWLWYCGRSNRLGVCDEIARLSNLRDWQCQLVSQPFSAASCLYTSARHIRSLAQVKRCAWNPNCQDYVNKFTRTWDIA